MTDEELNQVKQQTAKMKNLRLRMRKELTEVIEDHGARCWQKGYAFWQTPDYITARDRKSWSRGFDRAANEFGDIHNGRQGTWEWRQHHGYVGDV